MTALTWIADVAAVCVAAGLACATSSSSSASPANPTPTPTRHGPRLLSLAPNLTEIAFAAGAGGLLVGTVEYSDYPPAAKQVPLVGNAWRVDVERVLALHPDVVLAWATGTPETTIAQLRRVGLNVVDVQTQSLADIPRALRQLGRVGGTEAVAERAAQDFEARVARERADYANRTPLRVFIQVDDEPIFTVNDHSVISEIVTLCGGRNVFATLPQLAPPISAEAVLAADPQVIVSTDDTIADPIAQWKRWPRMQAVRSATVYSLPSDLVTRASPRLAEGVSVTCRALEDARQRLKRGQ